MFLRYIYTYIQIKHIISHRNFPLNPSKNNQTIKPSSPIYIGEVGLIV